MIERNDFCTLPFHGYGRKLRSNRFFHSLTITDISLHKSPAYSRPCFRFCKEMEENVLYNYLKDYILIYQYNYLSFLRKTSSISRQTLMQASSFPTFRARFHQIKTILTYTTRNRKTDCEKDLKELILTLTYKKTTEEELKQNFINLSIKYKEFLKKTDIELIDKITG